MAAPGFIHGHGPSASQFPSAIGQTTSAASLSVVLASDYTFGVTVTTTAATPLYTRLSDGTTAYNTVAAAQLPTTIGQKTAAASLSVVLASDQGTVGVTQSGTWNITNISGTVSLPTGASTSALQTTGNTSLASIDTKAVQQALDTGASTGAVRTVLSTRQEAAATPLSNRLSDGSAFYTAAKTGQLPTALGQALSAASLAVVIASDQSALTVSLPSGAATAAKQPALGTAGTASADVITVQGIASGTALTVDQTTATAVFQAEASIAGTSLTGSYATVFTTGGVMKWIALRNSCDKAVVVSLDGGTTGHFVLEAFEVLSIDLKDIGLSIANGTVIQAKHNGSTPTSGSIRVNGAR